MESFSAASTIVSTYKHLNKFLSLWKCNGSLTIFKNLKGRVLRINSILNSINGICKTNPFFRIHDMYSPWLGKKMKSGFAQKIVRFTGLVLCHRTHMPCHSFIRKCSTPHASNCLLFYMKLSSQSNYNL